MQRLVGTTINFEDQEVDVYYYAEQINEMLIYNETLGLTWINCYLYEDKSGKIEMKESVVKAREELKEMCTTMADIMSSKVCESATSIFDEEEANNLKIQRKRYVIK